MKLRYSASTAWVSAASAVGVPYSAASGVTASAPHMNAILPQWPRQIFGMMLGPVAIDSRSPANGSAPGHGSTMSPSADAACAASGAPASARTKMKTGNRRDGLDIGNIRSRFGLGVGAVRLRGQPIHDSRGGE